MEQIGKRSTYPVFAAELAGAALLAVGLWVRWAALALVPVLAGATLVHLPNGWSFAAPNGGWEYPAFLTAALVAQALLGAGAVAARRPAPARSAGFVTA